MAAYTVTISVSGKQATTYPCGGDTDQQALIYAGKVVEANADRFDATASVKIQKDDKVIGPAVTVADMIRKAI